MTRRAIVGKTPAPRRDYWGERIAEKERSGMSVQRFCEEQGLTEQSFYLWRKRLRQQEPVRFALVERGPAGQQPATEASLELVLATGERLRIGAGVEPGSSNPQQGSPIHACNWLKLQSRFVKEVGSPPWTRFELLRPNWHCARTCEAALF